MSTLFTEAMLHTSPTYLKNALVSYKPSFIGMFTNNLVHISDISETETGLCG